MIRSAALIATLLLVGCGGSVATQAAFMPTEGLLRPEARTIAPDTCNIGVQVVIKRVGGKFFVPKCSGWSGVIKYSSVTNHEARWTVTSSITNAFGAPAPPSGTAVFYMQMVDSTPPTFFSGGGKTITIVSPQLTAKHSYSLYVYHFYMDDQGCSTFPCPVWVANIGSPVQGKHRIAFSSPLYASEVFIPIVWQFVRN